MNTEPEGFSAKAFADHFGISKDTLLYYDRAGLFGPDHIAANGYRVYAKTQIEPFWALLVLRDAGVPIKEAKRYLEHPDPQALNHLVTDRIGAVDQEIRQLRRMRGHLEAVRDLTEEIGRAKRAQGRVLIEEVPVPPLILGAVNKLPGPTTPEAWTRLYEEFVAEKHLDTAARIGSIIDKKDLLGGTFDHVRQVFAIACAAQGNRRVTAAKKAELAAVHYRFGPYENAPASYPKILGHIAQAGFVVAGDAREEYLSTSLTAASEADFLTKITVPVQRPDA